MIRGLFITGCILAFVYMLGSIFMFIYVDDIRHNSYYSSYDYSYSSSYSSRPHVTMTRIMGGINAVAFLFFIFLYIYGMVKAKHTTVLVMGIIGLLFTAIAMLMDLVMVMDARHTTFDEIGPAFTIWGFFMLAFCIPCAILTGAKQLEEYRKKREYQKMMMNNPYQWQQQNPYYNQYQQQYANQQQYQQNPNQQQYQQNPNQQQYQQNPNQNPQQFQQNQNQNPQQNQNPYQYFNPYNPNPPQPPQPPVVPPPDNKS